MRGKRARALRKEALTASRHARRDPRYPNHGNYFTPHQYYRRLKRQWPQRRDLRINSPGRKSLRLRAVTAR
jgi:hypothetical protein